MGWNMTWMNFIGIIFLTIKVLCLLTSSLYMWLWNTTWRPLQNNNTFVLNTQGKNKKMDVCRAAFIQFNFFRTDSCVRWFEPSNAAVCPRNFYRILSPWGLQNIYALSILSGTVKTDVSWYVIQKFYVIR
jgi:hypothetical protein